MVPIWGRDFISARYHFVSVCFGLFRAAKPMALRGLYFDLVFVNA